MEKKIIGFAGRKRAGKGCLCQFLNEEYGATTVTIANALKDLCCTILGVPSIEELNQYKDFNTAFKYSPDNDQPRWTTLIADALIKNDDSEDEKNRKFAAVKERVAKFGDQPRTFTVRDMLQFIGTDVIREISPNWHIEKTVEAVNKAKTNIVCIDDVRFPNEKEAIEKLGGIVFYIIRPDLSIDISNHSSETSLGWSDFEPNRVLINYLDEDHLQYGFDDYFRSEFVFGGSNPILMSGAYQFDKENPRFGLFGKISPTQESIIRIFVLPNLQTDGSFTFHTTDMGVAMDVNKALYKHPQPLENGYHTFTVWNPYIIENLKRWLS